MESEATPRRSFIRNASGAALLAAAGVPSLAACAPTDDGADSAVDSSARGGDAPRDGRADSSDRQSTLSDPRSALSMPGPMLPPVPAVLLSVNGLPGDPDEISVVWSFVLNGEPAQIGISVGDEHVAGPAIVHHGEFVLNVPTADSIVAFDTVDMNSSRVGDKYELSGFTRGEAAAVSAPTVEESPLHLECRVTNTVPLPPIRTVFFADVVATTVLEGVVDQNERLIVPNVRFFGMTAGSGEFYTMGEPIGHIGHTVGRDDIRY
ncbi:MAG: flavin reductase [Gemmatimonadota bacterium]|nr:flavin reductase [Gemmatimonadota bacterium]